MDTRHILGQSAVNIEQETPTRAKRKAALGKYNKSIGIKKKVSYILLHQQFNDDSKPSPGEIM